MSCQRQKINFSKVRQAFQRWSSTTVVHTYSTYSVLSAQYDSHDEEFRFTVKTLAHSYKAIHSHVWVTWNLQELTLKMHSGVRSWFLRRIWTVCKCFRLLYVSIKMSTKSHTLPWQSQLFVESEKDQSSSVVKNSSRYFSDTEKWKTARYDLFIALMVRRSYVRRG